MIIKTKNDLDILKKGGAKLAQVLAMVVSETKPGVSTILLDEIAEAEILRMGGKPAFKDYRTNGTAKSYPATLCVSINDEIVHGIPGKRELKNGDVAGLDIGMEFEGIFTDMAVTVAVGDIGKDAERLIKVTEDALKAGIGAVCAGKRVGDISEAIQSLVEKNKFSVIRELVGHGVGTALHEDPEVPNWGHKGTGALLIEGMVIAIEPMVTIGSPKLKTSSDGWVWSTRSGKPSAHFEHTVLVTKSGSEIITKISYK